MSDDTLSLYFQLKPGEKADLEVAAKAAIAWAEGVRAAARALDPEAIVRIELVDAYEASLSFNTIVRWLEVVEGHLKRIEKGGKKLERVKRLAVGVAMMLVVTGPSTWDLYFGEDEFTPEDRQMLQDIYAKVSEDSDVKHAKVNFYRSVLSDPTIIGVGIKERPDDKPAFIVPNTLFAEGEGIWEAREAFEDKRTRHRTMDVIIVKPALVKTARSWTFREEGLPEFDAVMRDPDVLAAGGLPATMHEGVHIRVQMEFKETLVDGEWRLARAGRSVVKVLPIAP